MKTTIPLLSLALLLNFSAALQAADPRTNSWFTSYSGKYARIYTNDLARTNGNAVTTWTNGTLAQTLPAYCGVQEIYSSSNWVYIRSTGFGSHVMGAWYLDAAHTQIFPNFPTNQKTLFRIPRNPTVPTTKSLNGGGPIGYFVDGVAMFNSWDAYSWNGSADVQNLSSNYWNRDAYVNEGPTFDPGNAHQPGSGQYHYHANPPALRYLLGDHVDFNAATKIYTESTNSATKHSPILAWTVDGYPLYGPYGYSVATNAASGIRRMISGYVIRDGTHGTSNLTANGRTTLPQWSATLHNVASNIQSGPAVSSSYPLGRYMEDNDYLGDHGYTQGTDFDLDIYNGRYCVTPEFPNGTYAYFVAVNASGVPLFPYNIGLGYYGTVMGGTVTTISETVTTNFLGGSNSSATMSAPKVQNSTVTLAWSAVEGGSYQVYATTNPLSWALIASNVAPAQNVGGYTNITTLNQRYYRVARTGVASFDSAGTTTISGGGTSSANTVAPGGVATNGTTVSVTITLPTNPPSPPANAPITSVTLAGNIAGTGITDLTSGKVVATFAIPAGSYSGQQSIVIVFNNGPTYTVANALTIY